MPPRTKPSSRQAATAVLFGGIVLAVSMWTGQSSPNRVSSGSSPDATPTLPAPIMNSADAIQRSLSLFPAGGTPHGEVARLVNRLAFEVWVNDGVPGDDAAPEPDLFDWQGVDPAAPVWLVGVLGVNLTVADVLRVGAPPGVDLTDKREAPGAFFAWDANAAELIAQGALLEASGQTYDSLVALADMPLTPVAATPWPTDPPVTPWPTETWSPSELATAIAYLTAVPRSTP